MLSNRRVPAQISRAHLYKGGVRTKGKAGQTWPIRGPQLAGAHGERGVARSTAVALEGYRDGTLSCEQTKACPLQRADGRELVEATRVPEDRADITSGMVRCRRVEARTAGQALTAPDALFGATGSIPVRSIPVHVATNWTRTNSHPANTPN